MHSMAIETAEVWRCERCGHRWLVADRKKKPTWCAKCRSRNWDTTAVEVAPRDGLDRVIAHAKRKVLPPVKSAPPPTFVPDAATEQIEAYKKRPRAYDKPSVDAESRERLARMNLAKYGKK